MDYSSNEDEIPDEIYSQSLVMRSQQAKINRSNDQLSNVRPKNSHSQNLPTAINFMNSSSQPKQKVKERRVKYIFPEEEKKEEKEEIKNELLISNLAQKSLQNQPQFEIHEQHLVQSNSNELVQNCQDLVRNNPVVQQQQTVDQQDEDLTNLFEPEKVNLLANKLQQSLEYNEIFKNLLSFTKAEKFIEIFNKILKDQRSALQDFKELTEEQFQEFYLKISQAIKTIGVSLKSVTKVIKRLNKMRDQIEFNREPFQIVIKSKQQSFSSKNKVLQRPPKISSIQSKKSNSELLVKQCQQMYESHEVKSIEPVAVKQVAVDQLEDKLKLLVDKVINELSPIQEFKKLIIGKEILIRQSSVEILDRILSDDLNWQKGIDKQLGKLSINENQFEIFYKELCKQIKTVGLGIKLVQNILKKINSLRPLVVREFSSYHDDSQNSIIVCDALTEQFVENLFKSEEFAKVYQGDVQLFCYRIQCIINDVNQQNIQFDEKLYGDFKMKLNDHFYIASEIFKETLLANGVDIKNAETAQKLFYCMKCDVNQNQVIRKSSSFNFKDRDSQPGSSREHLLRISLSQIIVNRNQSLLERRQSLSQSGEEKSMAKSQCLILQNQDLRLNDAQQSVFIKNLLADFSKKRGSLKRLIPKFKFVKNQICAVNHNAFFVYNEQDQNPSEPNIVLPLKDILEVKLHRLYFSSMELLSEDEPELADQFFMWAMTIELISQYSEVVSQIDYSEVLSVDSNESIQNQKFFTFASPELSKIKDWIDKINEFKQL